MGFQNFYNKNLPGYIDYAGNTLGLNGACTSFSNIYTGCNSAGTSGVCGAWITTDTTKYASNNWHTFVNSLPYSSTNGGTTFNYSQNSSSDEINIPDGTSVDYAVLVWSGNCTSTSVNISTRSINLTDALNTLHSITPQYTSANSSTYGYYTCAADVTQIIKDAGNGYYIVGNVYSEFLTNTAYAGWLLIVVYTSPTMPFYNININVGNLDVSGDSSASTTISGFETPSAGTNIHSNMILTALNGNPASPGDQISLTNINSVETYLYGNLNPVDNFFGAQIEELDGVICTKGTFGNLNATPNTMQTTSGRRMGYDIAFVNTSSALSHHQTSTTLTGYTTGNNYSITSATSLIENTYPNISISSQTSDSSILIGDSYTITYNIKNIGTLTTDSIDFSFDDTGLEFSSGYYTISGTTYDIVSTPNTLALPNLDVSGSLILSMTFKATHIPNDLCYENLANLHYTFSLGNDILENTLENKIDVNISYVAALRVINLNSASTTPPLINPAATELSYSIATNPNKGNVTINNTTITYTPSSLQQTTDRFVIKITNNTNSNYINLVYNVAQIVVPIFRYTPVVPNNINLFSTAVGVYTFYNDAPFDTTNFNITASLPSGLSLIYATITDPQGNVSQMDRTANVFTVGTLPANSYRTVRFTYEATKLPTDLRYVPYGTSTFTIGGVNFTLVDAGGSIYPVANLNFTIPNNDIYSNVVPIIEADYHDLSYSIKTQGNLGTSTIGSNGLLTYTPNTDAVGSDNVVVTINNAQLGTTLDVKYTFNLIAPINLIIDLDFTIFKNNIFTKDIPISDPDYPNWTYTVKTQGSHGNASVNSSGLLTYTPNTDFVGNDSFTISMTNSQIEPTMNINYYITVADPVDMYTTLSLTIAKNEIWYEDISITDVNYPNWNYSIKTQGSHGNATINDSGILTYTPNADFTGNDDITITISNTDIETNLNINYVFDIVNPVNLPCPEYIPYKLVNLLNNDVYLMALNDFNISENVCFDCNLWNNGYISDTGVLIIPPIKTSLTYILEQLQSQLENILANNNPNDRCNDPAFKSQVDRLLSTVVDLENKISVINCTNINCNVNLLDSLLLVVSSTLNILITITSTLNGLLQICSNNCDSCNLSFSNLMSTFINSISDLYVLLTPWTYVVINFYNMQSLSFRPYNATYIPTSQIEFKNNNSYPTGFICPANMRYNKK